MSHRLEAAAAADAATLVCIVLTRYNIQVLSIFADKFFDLSYSALNIQNYQKLKKKLKQKR